MTGQFATLPGPPAKARLRRVSAVLFLAAILLFGHGAWIYAKASVAQVLLRRAWRLTVLGGTPVAPWPSADTRPIARLRAPRLEEDVIVLAGVSGRSLAFGPGHLDGSARPGEPGNCVISAHRDTQFAFLRRLEIGDVVDLETPDGGRHRYRVFERRVAHKSQVGLLQGTPEPTLTLVTCYPFDAVAPGGPLRYVVRARKEVNPPLSPSPSPGGRGSG
jgi:sortase A